MTDLDHKYSEYVAATNQKIEDIEKTYEAKKHEQAENYRLDISENEKNIKLAHEQLEKNSKQHDEAISSLDDKYRNDVGQLAKANDTHEKEIQSHRLSHKSNLKSIEQLGYVNKRLQDEIISIHTDIAVRTSKIMQTMANLNITPAGLIKDEIEEQVIQINQSFKNIEKELEKTLNTE